MAEFRWNDAAFMQLAKSAPVKAAVGQAAERLCAEANARARGHLGTLKAPTSHGSWAPVRHFAKPPYAAKVKTLDRTSFGAVESATPIGAHDHNQFHTLNQV